MAERLLVIPALALRLDYARPIVADARGARVVEILSERLLGLSNVAASTQKEKTRYQPATEAQLTGLIASGDYFDLSLESSGKELENRASVGLRPRSYDQGPCPLTCSLAMPLPQDHQSLIDVIVQLADALGASAGFLAIEPTVSLAYKLAVGSSIPTARRGLSDERRRARRAYDMFHEQVSTKLATVEWGTFLGPGHLAQVDLEKLRASGAFSCIAGSTSLVFLQLTTNPLDDLSGELEPRLVKARDVLGTLPIDSSGVNLE